LTILEKTAGQPIYVSATFKNTGNVRINNLKVQFVLYPSEQAGYDYLLGPLDVGSSVSISNQKAIETAGLSEGNYALRMNFSDGDGPVFQKYDILDWTISILPKTQASLKVTAQGLTIAGAVQLHPEIYVDGVYAGVAPVTVSVSPGTHEVAFGAIEGWVTPSVESVTVSAGQTAEVLGQYTVAPPTNITLKVYVLTSTGAGVSGIPVTVTPIVNGTPDTSKAVTQYTDANGVTSFSIPPNSGQYQVKAETYPASSPKTITAKTDDITLTFTSAVY
jgi:hypothetical protein